jgi:hypothetical protein
MKKILIAIIILLLQCNVSMVSAQNSKVTIQQSKTNFSSIITEFENQANLLFVYDANIVSNKKMYTCNAVNIDWQIALDAFLKPWKLTYIVSGHQIIIKPLGKQLVDILKIKLQEKV